MRPASTRKVQAVVRDQDEPQDGAPPRRTCIACRQAKRMCDKERPKCSRCLKLGLECIPQARGPGRPWPRRPPASQAATLGRPEPPLPPPRAPPMLARQTSPGALHRQQQPPQQYDHYRDLMLLSRAAAPPQPPQQPLIRQDHISLVSEVITAGILRMARSGTIDPLKLDDERSIIDNFNRLGKGRDAAGPFREALDWAAGWVSSSQSKPEPGPHSTQYLAVMADEGGCYLRVTYGGPAVADIYTSEAMTRLFIAAEEIVKFFEQTGLTHIYTWASFLDDQASIIALYEALIKASMLRGAAQPVEVMIQCRTRDLRVVPCLARVAREPCSGGGRGLLMLQLLPQPEPPRGAADGEPPPHGASPRKRMRLSPPSPPPPAAQGPNPGRPGPGPLLGPSILTDPRALAALRASGMLHVPLPLPGAAPHPSTSSPSLSSIESRRSEPSHPLPLPMRTATGSSYADVLASHQHHGQGLPFPSSSSPALPPWGAAPRSSASSSHSQGKREGGGGSAWSQRPWQGPGRDTGVGVGVGAYASALSALGSEALEGGPRGGASSWYGREGRGATGLGLTGTRPAPTQASAAQEPPSLGLGLGAAYASRGGPPGVAPRPAQDGGLYSNNSSEDSMLVAVARPAPSDAYGSRVGLPQAQAQNGGGGHAPPQGEAQVPARRAEMGDGWSRFLQGGLQGGR